MTLSADILLDKIEWTTCIKLDTKSDRTDTNFHTDFVTEDTNI